MSSHEAFNRSALSRFLNSTAGRIFRLGVGSCFLVVGYLLRDQRLGLASMAWALLPLTAGGFDVCYISLALGGPFSGARIRSAQRL